MFTFDPSACRASREATSFTPERWQSAMLGQRSARPRPLLRPAPQSCHEMLEIVSVVPSNSGNLGPPGYPTLEGSSRNRSLIPSQSTVRAASAPSLMTKKLSSTAPVNARDLRCTRPGYMRGTAPPPICARSRPLSGSSSAQFGRASELREIREPRYPFAKPSRAAEGPGPKMPPQPPNSPEQGMVRQPGSMEVNATAQHR